MLDGMESDEPVKHDDWAWFAIVTGPSSEPCKGPCRKGKRAFRVRIFLPCGVSFEVCRNGFESFLIVRIEYIFERAFGNAVTLAHELEYGDGGDHGGGNELFEGAVFRQTRGFDVEALRLERAEELFDGPALTIEADDTASVGSIGDDVGGEQAPMRGCDAFRRSHLTRFHQRQWYAFRQGRRIGLRPVPRAHDLHWTEVQSQNRSTGGTAGSGGQVNAHAAGLRQQFGLGEQARSVIKTTILASTDQHLNAARLAGKILVYVALAIGNHCDKPRARGRKIGRTLSPVEPAAALLVGEVPLPALLPLATSAHEETRIDEPKQGALDRINRDDRMQGHAATVTTGANAGRILDREHMMSYRTRTRARRGRLHHLGHAHRRIVQEPKQPDLARPVLAQAANPHSTTASLDQAPMQKDPPFSSRRSPKRPSVKSVMAAPFKSCRNRESDPGLQCKPIQNV